MHAISVVAFSRHYVAIDVSIVTIKVAKCLRVVIFTSLYSYFNFARLWVMFFLGGVIFFTLFEHALSTQGQSGRHGPSPAHGR